MLKSSTNTFDKRKWTLPCTKFKFIFLSRQCKVNVYSSVFFLFLFKFASRNGGSPMMARSTFYVYRFPFTLISFCKSCSKLKRRARQTNMS